MKYEKNIDFLINLFYTAPAMITEELFEKCVNKDPEAWDEFVKRYKYLVTRSVKYKLYKLGVRFLRDEILDIVQEIFLFIWEKDKLQKVKNLKCLRAWLAIVSINFTSDYCKKSTFSHAKNTLLLNENTFFENPEITPELFISSPELNTAKMLESNELWRALGKEMSKLRPQQQLALKFNIYEGKKQKEIARIMNIPLNTVSTLIKRAKMHLRKNLKEAFEKK